MSPAENVGSLQLIASEHPDAPRWWIGDWANEGERRFGVTLENAVETANVAARELQAMVTSPSKVSLPRDVEADAVSLRLPDELPIEEWERLGGIIVAVHTIQERAAAPPSTHFSRFRFGDMFPPNDLLSEWLATIAMAANDLLTLIVLSHGTNDARVQWYYFRARIGHFYEIAKHLEETADLPVIKAFVESLPDGAQASYRSVLEIFSREKTKISNVRQIAFHYPSLMNPQMPGVVRANRKLPPALRATEGQMTGVRLGMLRDARFLFADDLAMRLLLRQVGGERNFVKLEEAIADGIHAFMRFMNPALSEHLSRREDAGATVTYSE